MVRLDEKTVSVRLFDRGVELVSYGGTVNAISHCVEPAIAAALEASVLDMAFCRNVEVAMRNFSADVMVSEGSYV